MIRILIGCRRLCSHTRLIIGCRPRSKLVPILSTLREACTMDVDEALVVMYYYLRRKRRKTAKERKYWVHPILRERFSLGTFQNLITELRSDEIKFFNYFRMSITTFNHLLAQISVSINYQNTRFRDCICTEERLAIFLR